VHKIDDDDDDHDDHDDDDTSWSDFKTQVAKI
jgi:hypothetical protein